MASNPFPGSVIPVESIVARHIVARAAYLALPLVALCWFLRGPEGAFAGALGLVIVVLHLFIAEALARAMDPSTAELPAPTELAYTAAEGSENASTDLDETDAGPPIDTSRYSTDAWSGSRFA